MKRVGIAAGAGLVIAVNAFVLGRVALNRTGGSEASMTLTERELPVAFSSPQSESSGVALRFDVEHWMPWFQPGPEFDTLGWLDAPKLAELGFDVRLPPKAEEASEFLQRQLARTAYAALEYQGRAWESYRESLARRYGLVAGTKPGAAFQPSELKVAEQELHHGSRLFIVDVDADCARLRSRHPDRTTHVVVPVKVRAFLDHGRPEEACSSPSCRVRGSVSLVVDELVVPRHLQAAIPAASRSAPGNGAEPEPAPRYEVALKSGKRCEAWVGEIRALRHSSP